MSTFIRLTNTNYLLQDQTTPLEIASVENSCDLEEIYPLPAKPGDTISWIQDKSTFDLKGTELSELRVALVNQGTQVALNIASITETEDQFFITVTIPNDIVDCEYRLALYSNTDPIVCGQFQGMTLGQVITEGPILGQVVQCTLEDFI